MNTLVKCAATLLGLALMAAVGPAFAGPDGADDRAARPGNDTGHTMARCMPFQEMSDQLKDVFGEQPTAMGLSEEGRRVYQIFVSEAGTWTLVVTYTNGSTCIASSGSGWTEIPPLNMAEKAT